MARLEETSGETVDGAQGGAPDEGAFARSAEAPAPGLVREMADFLLANKKWWLLPIIVMLLAVTALVFLSGTVIAPFIYPLF